MSFSSLISLWRLSCHVRSKSQKLPSDVKGKAYYTFILKTGDNEANHDTNYDNNEKYEENNTKLFFPLKYVICVFFLL